MEVMEVEVTTMKKTEMATATEVAGAEAIVDVAAGSEMSTSAERSFDHYR